MSFIKEESENIKTEETFGVKHEDTEEQTKTVFIKEERAELKIEETYSLKHEDAEEQTDSCTNQDDDNPEEAETFTCSTASSLTQRSKRTEKRKRESNQDLLEYFQAADKRFMLQTREMHQDILKRMNDTSASLLGLLGRMITVMETEQRKEI